MPVLSFAHSKFWRQRANPVAPPPVLFGGYPLWQSSVVVGSLIGGCQLFYERLCSALRWFRWGWSHPYTPEMQQWADTVAALTPDQRLAVEEAARVVRLPQWATARDAVFATSRAEKFNEYQEWAKLGNALRNSRGMAENTWRHLHACHALRDEQMALGNPTLNLMVELAYHEFAASGRGKPPRIA